MALLERLMERRAISPATLFGTGLDTYFASRNESGISVDVDSAFTLSAFWACVRLLASDISTLPGHAYRQGSGARELLPDQPAWIKRPDAYDPSITIIDHFAQVGVSALTDGNAFVLALPSVIEPLVLQVVDPSHVEVKKPGKFPEYHIRDRSGQTAQVVGPDVMVHVALFRRPGALRGSNPVRASAEGIGLGLATQKYTARLFGNGSLIPGFIEVPGDPQQSAVDEMAKRLSERHAGWRSAGLLGFLTGGAKFASTGITPKDSDLTAQRKYQVEEMARIFGIPPHMIGSQEAGAVAYASVEQRSIDYVVHTLRHYVEPIEAAYSRLVPGDSRRSVPGSNTYFKFNVAALLRGDNASRMTAYAAGLLNGIYSIDEVRALEDLPPTDGGDVHRVQAQMTDITAEPVVPPPAAVASPAAREWQPIVNLPTISVRMPDPPSDVPAPEIAIRKAADGTVYISEVGRGPAVAS